MAQMGSDFISQLFHERCLLDTKNKVPCALLLNLTCGHELGLEAFSVSRHRFSVDISKSEFVG